MYFSNFFTFGVHNSVSFAFFSKCDVLISEVQFLP